MEAIQARLIKLREERLAREKARIEKLREINLSKYKSQEIIKPKPLARTVSESGKFGLTQKPSSNRLIIPPVPKTQNTKPPTSAKATNNIKPITKSNSATSKGTVKTAPKSETVRSAPVNKANLVKNLPAGKANETKKVPGKIDTIKNTPVNVDSIPIAPSIKSASSVNVGVTNKMTTIKNRKSTIPDIKNIPKVTKPDLTKPDFKLSSKNPLPRQSRASMAPKSSITEKKQFSRRSYAPTTTRESVFDRLYTSKSAKKPSENEVDRIKNDFNYRNKLIQQSEVLFNTKPVQRVRRSISAVHFRRIGKEELPNCMHKWASQSDLHPPITEEDAKVNEEKVVSAVKSDRKRVTFKRTFNTPKPVELQSRLQSWLQKRGKCIEKYQHLQCFGLHHMNLTAKELKPYDDENKENIAVQSDSDNDSFEENMNIDKTKWRRASYMSSTDFDETKETIFSEDVSLNSEELVVGALNDLTELIREGFDWEQAARWLRSIRERFPFATDTASYWECRAALEEQQGNLPASVQCWEEAIAKGTEKSVVEANLDQLLAKFMQLKISPNSAKKKQQLNPKMVDVKNVFKSTIIRFAVQQAKLRQSNQSDTKYIITPVRRSGRTSSAYYTPRGNRTPLVQLCSSIRQIHKQLGVGVDDATFVPNQTLNFTP